MKLFFCSLFIVLLLLQYYSLPATPKEVDNEREFDYNYHGEIGPHRWGEIKPEWRACNHGSMQSPIDLLNERIEVVSHLGRIHRDYKPSNATIRNRGHDIMLTWVDGAGTLEINGTEYELQQCHWHSPSEHTINGKRFDLEAHLVHESPDGNVAVIGIMYTIGRPDTFLSSIMDYLSAITDNEDHEQIIGVVNPRDIKFGSRKYYRYIGSLTTPPCTENVIWTIIRKVRTVTREQVRLLRVAVHDESDSNARPLQPINERLIQLYRPCKNEQNRKLL